MQRTITEAEIIRRVAARFPAMQAGSVLETGIGDDTAVLNLAAKPDQKTLVTTDTLIEGVHFDFKYMTLADVGYKALAVNLSDINAMGGESVAALGTLGVPKSATLEQIEALLDGIEVALKLCKDAGQNCALIGGDTIASPQWMVGFTVIGAVADKPLLRSGSKPGDLVWHSGMLGLSGIGFEQLRRGGAPPPPAQAHLQSGGRQGGPPTTHIHPIPPLTLGPWLQRNGYASAAQDLSDSLSQVALQLAAASGVGIELDFRDYQFAPEVIEFANENEENSVAGFLLAQAEDYQLLFTVSPEFEAQIADAPVQCTRIGRMAEGGNSYFDEHGKSHELKAVGFEHL